MSLWSDFYLPFVHDLNPCLDAMDANGVPVDQDRQAVLRSKIDVEINEIVDQVQQYVPEAIRPRKRYVKEPTGKGEYREILIPGKVKMCSCCGAKGVTKTQHLKGGKANPCAGASIVEVPDMVRAFDLLLPFNPMSHDQLKDYIRMMGHPMGQNWKTGQDSSDQDHIKKLVRAYGDNYPLYAQALRGSSLQKARSYLFTPDAFNLVHGRFTHNPETFRLAQQDENLMNVPKRGEKPYAAEIRETVVAGDGYVFVEADSASVEAVMVGYFMGSKSYMERAKKGIHTWWACKTLGIPFEPGAKKFITTNYEILYERKKRTVHGVSYGMTAYLLADKYPLLFPTEEDAQRELEEFLALVPEIGEWWESLRDYAFRHTFIESPWGLRNYYYQVYSWWKGQRKLGEDAKALVAFLPQHANAMFQRENLKLIYDSWARPYMPANGHCHDSNSLRVPEDKVDAAVELLGEIMSRPIKQLRGLQVGVEIKVGQDWHNMKTVKTIE